jgi:hypothetical protein
MRIQRARAATETIETKYRALRHPAEIDARHRATGEAAHPPKEAKMGLNERRKMKDLQEVTFPERVKEIAEICGAPIPYEVDWESLTDDLTGLNFIDNASCHRLNMALRVICQDELGKEAVREGLRKIKLKNVHDKADIRLVFHDGVLEMSCVYAQGMSGSFSDGDIRNLLVERL